MSKTPAETFLDTIRNVLPCCVNCSRFSTSVYQQANRTPATREYCTLDEYQRTPPAKIIAFGCPNYVTDVPF